ncbi:MAG: NifB/NifX family molybdenum-iron cluster-binding protein, partial [Desulfomonilia bacterium]|nr:NifB/NifX family molybdenum-iron cluster-binding protein [Desulfomonilia bacterium]
AVMEASDEGTPFIYTHSASEAAQAFSSIVKVLMELETEPREDASQGKVEAHGGQVEALDQGKPQDEKACQDTVVKIAVPVTGGVLSSHFGHCESFALFDVDPQSRTITNRQDLQAPPHEPGLLPAWLGEKGANMIIAGGMGSRAQDLFAERGIQVVVGAQQNDPQHVIESFLSGDLQTGDNLCDH